MELDEVRSIWNMQREQAPYQVDEQRLHQQVLARKSRALHITSISELLIIGIYIGVGIFVAFTNATSSKISLFMYAAVAWMLLVALLTVISRIRRIKGNRKFDRSVQGELQHGLALARYQVRLSRLMRLNTALLCCLMLFACWEKAKPWWATMLILAIFGLGWFVSGWEHNKHKMQKRKLEELEQSLGKS